METRPVSSVLRSWGWVFRASVIAALVLCAPSAAEATSFTFTLTQDSKTSAGVFSVGGSSDGTLIKTLWSGVSYPAGTYTKDWDGTDDTGRLAADGNYQVRVLGSQTSYIWEGVVGNTSTQPTGDSVFHFASTISGMAVVGTTAYFAAGYNEGGTGQARFETTAPGAKTNILSRGAEFYKVASDGTNVYWAGGDFTSKGFVTATPVGSTTTQTQFQAGQPVDTTPHNGIVYTHAIDIMTANPQLPYPTGLAVQSGANGYLFVSWEGQDSLHVLNKTTGAPASTPEYAFIAPGDLAIGPVNPIGDGSLWMIHGPASSRVVQLFRVTVNGTLLLPAEVTINGLQDPLALAYQGGTLLVADGGDSQQVKAFNVSGAPLWELPEDPGGYATDPVVTNDRFDFEPLLEYTNTFTTLTNHPGTRPGILEHGTFLAFQPDGSFWVGDTGCYRAQHFYPGSAGRVFIDQVAYIPSFYSAAADPNNPRRVFANYLEFDVNYDLPLGPANGSWSLVRNWRHGMTGPVESQYGRMADVMTFSNGHTFVYSAELPSAGGGQATHTPAAPPGFLSPDGSARTRQLTASETVETWKSYPLAGYEDDIPFWSSTPEWQASVTRGLADPHPTNISGVKTTSGNVIVSFDRHSVATDPGSPYHQGWHLGGVRTDSNQWLWKASYSTPLNYNGLWPTDGTFPITKVGNAGSGVMTVDRHIIYGYHGEAWTHGEATSEHCLQTNKYRHYYDDGLFVGEFGPTWMDVGCVEAPPGMAGNAISPWLVKLADGRAYLYHNDESWHGGLHRWKIDGLSSVAEQTIAIEVRKDTDHGLSAEYFDTPDWNNLNLKATRVDPQVVFSNWNAGSPAGTGLAADQSFSVRWSGYVIPQVSGNHRFRVETQAPASAQVKVDGRKLAPTDDIALTGGVYHPIAIEYRHVPGSPAPTGPKLKWSSDPALPEQDVPSAQLSAVPAGTDLLEGLPSSGMVADGTAGWVRSPAADQNLGYWHRWNVDVEQNGGNPYLHIHRVENTPGATASVTRDLGTPSDSTTSWDVSMMVSYANSYVNEQMVCGQTLDLLDDAGKVIASVYPNMFDWPNDGRLVANGDALVQTDVGTLQWGVLPTWRPLRISAVDGNVTFQYGDYPAKTTLIYDPTANWRRVKTLRAHYWTNQEYCAHDIGIDIDRLRLVTNRPPDEVQPLMEGLPASGMVADATAGWGRTPATNHNLGYWHRWNVDVEQNSGNRYLHIHRVENTPGSTAVVTRDLGTPSNTTASWDVSMMVSYANSYVNEQMVCGQSLDLLDDAGKVITSVYPNMFDWPNDGRLVANGAALVQTDVGTLQWGVLPTWRPLRISAANGQITFKYGDYPAKTTPAYEPTANWRRVKTLRAYYWTNQEYCAHDIGIDIDNLQLATTDPSPAVDLLAGVPSDGNLQTWGINGDYGWTATSFAGQQPYWDQWWVKSNQKTWQRSPPVDIGVVYIKTGVAGDASNPAFTLSRDLGTPSDTTTRWELAGRVTYDESELNTSDSGGQNLEVLDDANPPHVIARFVPPSFLPSWQPLRVVGEDGVVTFHYGNNAPVPKPAEAGSNWRRAKTMRLVFWKDGNPPGQRRMRSAFLDDLKYRVTRPPQ